VASCLLALSLGQTAQGKLDPASHKQVHHTRIMMPHKHFVLPVVIKWQHRIIRHDQWVIRTSKFHDVKVVKWHRAQLRWTLRELQQSLHLQSELQQRSMLGGACISCWEQVASCESGNNWQDNTGNNFYGGLQFTYTTWINSGGGRYASRADYATEMQQIAIASHLSLSNWPVCGARY
jgi:hypothetical protein